MQNPMPRSRLLIIFKPSHWPNKRHPAGLGYSKQQAADSGQAAILWVESKIIKIIRNLSYGISSIQIFASPRLLKSSLLCLAVAEPPLQGRK